MKMGMNVEAKVELLARMNVADEMNEKVAASSTLSHLLSFQPCSDTAQSEWQRTPTLAQKRYHFRPIRKLIKNMARQKVCRKVVTTRFVTERDSFCEGNA